LGLGFSVGDVIIGPCFHAVLAEVTYPWAPTQKATFLAEVFVESRLSCESSEPLTGLLAYLESKSWLKNQKLGKNSNHTKGNLGHCY